MKKELFLMVTFLFVFYSPPWAALSSVTNFVSQFVAERGTLGREGGIPMMSRDELRLLVRETLWEMVAQELQTLLFLEGEAFVQENEGRKNGNYPRKLKMPFG